MTIENKKLEEIKLICETVFALEKLKSSCGAICEYREIQPTKEKIHDLQRQILIKLKEL